MSVGAEKDIRLTPTNTRAYLRYRDSYCCIYNIESHNLAKKCEVLIKTSQFVIVRLKGQERERERCYENIINSL